ncbi:HAD hydrolase-like protein [Clostridium minihomine]|uniref:HAD hydrolase-like protein n=1 Tax=Clostridium minihomine TaxID=2045012 RepID=UPI000C778597|nr:HAD hydrolase-like protein [Clostridium minihomine]
MKPVYPFVLFDLDGTLTESGPGVISTVQKVLAQINHPEPPQELLRTFIGPPLYQSFTETCGISHEKSEEAVLLYRKLYEAEGIFQNSVYPYTQELLSALRKAGAKICIATSKPQKQAERVAQIFNLYSMVDYISGPGDEKEHSSSKTAVIQKCLDHFSAEPGQAVMIGDTRFDANGALEAGMDFIGVLHGYGTQQEMLDSFPKARFVPDFVQLEKLLLTNEANVIY